MSRHHEESAVGPGRLSCALLIGLVWLGCSVPGRLYEVTPPIRGQLSEGERTIQTGEVLLTVRHRENSRLYSRLRVSVDEQGRFAFPAAELSVAAQEYDKRYSLYLHHTREDERTAIWKADYSRLELGEPVVLDCDIARAPLQGVPCQVVGGGRAHGWIIEAGERDFVRYCASCHGRDALGDGPAGFALKTTPPDLTRIAARRGGKFPAGEIADWIDGRLLRSHGTSEMPVWGTRLSEEYVPGEFADALARGRVGSIVSYLETLQQPAER